MVQYINIDRETSIKIAVYFLVVLLLSQCSVSSTKSGTNDLIEVDVSNQKYPVKELYLQDIATVEYIPLETNRNTLMRSSARIVHVSDDYIVASNMSDGDVFVFDGKGKSRFSFNHKGRGPTEYNQLYSISFDEIAKELFIFDSYSANPKFMVYTEEGYFKRTLTVPSNFSPRDVYNFNEETLLVYDVWGLNTNNYSKKPYTFISKKNGNIVDTLGIHLAERISNRVFFEVEVNGQKGMMPISLNVSNNLSHGKNILIFDWASDTIYRLTPQKELLPLIVRKPSVHSTNPKMIISNELLTDKFILFTKAVLDFEMAKSKKTFPTMALMYDFKTEQLYEYNLLNKDFDRSGVGFVSAKTPENTGVCQLDVSYLFEADEAGRIKGELKELLKTLKEEDNPVLMKIKF